MTIAAQMHMKIVLLSLAVVGIVTTFARAQSPGQSPTTSPRAAAITGRVLADSTGEPIRNARVAVLPEPPQGPAVALSDADGLFSLTAPGGNYRVVAGKTGYTRGEAMPAVRGQAIEIRLKKGAAISGKVLDELGDPVIGVRVAALTQAEPAKNAATVATTDTDDRGEYRLAGLTDGSLVVAVTTLGARGRSVNFSTPRTTYFPGTAMPGDAQALRVQPGENRLGIDIVVPAGQLSGMPVRVFASRFLRPSTEQFPAPPSTGAVRGRVVSTDGRPMSNADVFMFTSTRDDSKTATADDDGRFEFEEVAAGTFLISVSKPGYAQIESGRAITPFPMGRAVTSPDLKDTGLGRTVALAAGEIRIAWT